MAAGQRMNNNPTWLVGGIVLGKPYPGQAPRSTGGDVCNNHAPCCAIPLVQLGCAGPEHARGAPAGTADLGVVRGIHGVTECGDGRT